MSLFQTWGALGDSRASLLILPAILRARSPGPCQGDCPEERGSC